MHICMYIYIYTYIYIYIYAYIHIYVLYILREQHLWPSITDAQPVAVLRFWRMLTYADVLTDAVNLWPSITDAQPVAVLRFWRMRTYADVLTYANSTCGRQLRMPSRWLWSYATKTKLQAECSSRFQSKLLSQKKRKSSSEKRWERRLKKKKWWECA